jgi:hypothetical protein
MALAKTPWHWETVTQNLAAIRAWGEDFTIRHLVIADHVECCSFPVLDWIALHLPGAPVNITDQYHPDNFCDPASVKYRPQYAPAHRPRAARGLPPCAGPRPRVRDRHLRGSWARALAAGYGDVDQAKRRSPAVTTHGRPSRPPATF